VARVLRRARARAPWFRGDERVGNSHFSLSLTGLCAAEISAGARVDLDQLAFLDEQRHLNDFAGLQGGRLLTLLALSPLTPWADSVTLSVTDEGVPPGPAPFDAQHLDLEIFNQVILGSATRSL
jgi:hypothetical protein